MGTIDSERYYIHKGKEIDWIKYMSMFKPKSFELTDEKFKEEVLELKKFRSGNSIDVISYNESIKPGDYRYPLLFGSGLGFGGPYLHIEKIKDINNKLYEELIKEE